MQAPCPPATVRERRRRLVWPGIQSFERRTSPLLAMVAYGTCLVRRRYAVPDLHPTWPTGSTAQFGFRHERDQKIPVPHQWQGKRRPTGGREKKRDGVGVN